MSNLPAIVNFSPVMEVPAEAAPLKVDVLNPDLSFDDVLPKQYLSMEALAAWLEVRGASSRIVTIAAVTMEWLYDPQREPASAGEWKPVLWFADMESGLVINQTRGKQLTKLAGDPRLVAWSKLGQVTIAPGIDNGKAQIVIGRVPGAGPAGEAAAGGRGRKTTIPQNYSAQDANEELFS